MSDKNKGKAQEEKPQDHYQKYKDFKWENPDQFKNVPIDDETRKCRDCICTIIFLVMLVLYIVFAAFGFIKGKPSQLFYFYDGEGKACGHEDGHPDYTLTPDEYKNKNYTLDCGYQSESFDVTYKDYYVSKEFLGRVCFPKTDDEIHYNDTNGTIQKLIKIYDPKMRLMGNKIVKKLQ